MGAAVNTDVSNNEKYTNDIKLDKSKTKNSFKNKIQRIFDIVKKKFRLHKKKSTKNSIKKSRPMHHKPKFSRKYAKFHRGQNRSQIFYQVHVRFPLL
ncbi:hypothetical protein GJ496_011584 [Pomphorhynchus laevis]|nr:hypothetical protein GJ496_011584 [Pomphorhynchus laevis]